MDLDAVDASVLLKFHVSVDAPGSLAFTDLEQLAPYAADELGPLAALATSRRVVVHGYAGADADLRDLVWYEPLLGARERIRRTFDGLPIAFDPDPLPDAGRDPDTSIAATAAAFLAAADALDLLDGTPPSTRRRSCTPVSSSGSASPRTRTRRSPPPGGPTCGGAGRGRSGSTCAGPPRAASTARTGGSGGWSAWRPGTPAWSGRSRGGWRPSSTTPEPAEPPGLTRRQFQDVALLRADVALAAGDMTAADRHLTAVERSPANEVALAWARLGRAEHARRTGATSHLDASPSRRQTPSPLAGHVDP